MKLTKDWWGINEFHHASTCKPSMTVNRESAIYIFIICKDSGGWLNWVLYVWIVKMDVVNTISFLIFNFWMPANCSVLDSIVHLAGHSITIFIPRESWLFLWWWFNRKNDAIFNLMDIENLTMNKKVLWRGPREKYLPFMWNLILQFCKPRDTNFDYKAATCTLLFSKISNSFHYCM